MRKSPAVTYFAYFVTGMSTGCLVMAAATPAIRSQVWPIPTLAQKAERMTADCVQQREALFEMYHRFGTYQLVLPCPGEKP